MFTGCTSNQPGTPQSLREAIIALIWPSIIVNYCGVLSGGSLSADQNIEISEHSFIYLTIFRFFILQYKSFYWNKYNIRMFWISLLLFSSLLSPLIRSRIVGRLTLWLYYIRWRIVRLLQYIVFLSKRSQYRSAALWSVRVSTG